LSFSPAKTFADVAKKLRELAAQVKARAHLTPAILRGDEAHPAHQSESA
jgi:hypothetical protein